MNLPKQTEVKTLKQFWMRVSFMDGIKLGIGFAIGTSIAAFIMGFMWFLAVLMFGFIVGISPGEVSLL